MVAHSRTAEYYRAWRAAHAEYRKRESQRAGVRKRAARQRAKDLATDTATAWLEEGKDGNG